MRSLSATLFFSVLCLTSPVYSQTFAEITGEIHDSSGAAISGAQVTATNAGTNAVRVATTNEAGIYTIGFLVPSTYSVKVEKAGFKSATRNGVELQVQQSARIDFELPVGQVNESIEVTSAAPLLTTE